MITNGPTASPFVDDSPVANPVARATMPMVFETPFRGEHDGFARAETTFARELYESLEDPGFAEALEDLAEEVRASVPSGMSEVVVHQSTEIALRHRLHPVLRRAHGHIDRLGRVIGHRDIASVQEHELYVEEHELDAEDAGSPAMEQFISALKNKLTKAVKGAVRAVKSGISKGVQAVAKVALGPLLDRLKRIVKPLLDRVLGWALDKLPPQYREAARGLAQKLGLRVSAAVSRVATSMGAPASMLAQGRSMLAAAAPAPAPSPMVDIAGASASSSAVAPAGSSAVASAGDVTTVAPVASGATGGEQWQEPGDAGDDALDDAPVSAPVGVPTAEELELELDSTITELLTANESDPEAALVRYESLALSDHEEVADRARAAFATQIARLREDEDPTPLVEGFLPAILPLVRMGIKIIGRKRVVDFIAGAIGSLIRPLVGPSIAPGLGQAIADLGLRALVQAELGEPPEPGRVGAEALVSTVEETVRMLGEFPQAVLESPPLLEAALLEAFEVASAANMPPEALKPHLRESTVPGAWVRRPARGPALYKKFTHVFAVELTPQLLAGVRVFAGRRLDQWINDAIGQAPAAKLNARVHLFEVGPRTSLSRIARHERVLSPYRGRVRRLLHPLTVEAAGVLLQQPKLGRGGPLPTGDRRIAVGQRLYFLELDRPFSASFAPKVFEAMGDGPNRMVKLRLSETMAQRLAVAVREGKSAGVLVHRLRQAMRGVRIPLWVWTAIAQWLATHSQVLVTATEGQEDGITWSIRPPDAPAGSDRVTVKAGLSASA